MEIKYRGFTIRKSKYNVGKVSFKITKDDDKSVYFASSPGECKNTIDNLLN